MKRMNLFGREIENFVDLMDTVCENVLDSNYFLTGETLDINLIDTVKPYLDDGEMEEFKEFIDKL